MDGEQVANQVEYQVGHRIAEWARNLPSMRRQVGIQVLASIRNHVWGPRIEDWVREQAREEHDGR